MKKLIFLKACHDKNTKENYAPGFIKEFEDERADEILEVEGYAEEVPEEETKKEDGEGKNDDESEETETKEEEKKPEEKKGKGKDK